MIIKGNGLYYFHIPGDFTPVCTTEIIGFSRANTYFENLNTKLIGLSVDSNSSHLAWFNDIYERTGTIIDFPIIADRNGEIARKYGMISTDISNIETVRNVFIIDDEGVIRAIFIYPMNVGRSISEIIRTLEGLQIADNCKGATPLNWIQGNPVIRYSPNTYEELQKHKQEIIEKRNGMSWYLSFKDASGGEKNAKNNI